MIETDIDDATLMALADGELPETLARMVRGRIAADPKLAARFALFVETRALVRHAASDARDPAAAGWVGRPPAKSRAPMPRPQRRSRWQMPLAASLLLAVGGLAGYILASSDTVNDSVLARAILAVPGAESALTEALDTLPSGRELRWSSRSSGLSGRIAILSTHKLGDATYCREYEISFEGRMKGAVVGASCRRNGVWQVAIAAAKPDQSSGYAPASGASAVEQYLANLGSAAPISADEEKSRLARGW